MAFTKKKNLTRVSLVYYISCPRTDDKYFVAAHLSRAKSVTVEME